MESTIVIKVKFGETLRRFNAGIVDETLDLDMVRLREKILSLFNFAPDADLTLTYVDEDGDVVTLADEDDLCDVMRQSLNPLRITVMLNNEKTGRSYARSSGNSTPMRSPRGQHPMQNLNASVSEILKSVPEPLRDAFSKLSADLASTASSSGSGVIGLAELVDTFSNIGLTYLSRYSDVQAGPESRTVSGASESKVGASDIKGQPGLKVDVGSQEKLPGIKPEASTLEYNKVPLESSSKNKELVLQKVAQGDASVVPPPGFPSSKVNPLPEESHLPVKKEEVKGFGWNMWKPSGQDIPAAAKQKDAGKSSQVNWNNTGFDPDYLKRCLQDSQTMGMGGGLSSRPNDTGSSSAWHYGPTSFNECPFTGMPLANDSAMPPMSYVPRVAPFKRSYNHGDGIGSIFHRGVRCDGCGVHPITGPRFKSKVKDDYDLCSVCFTGMGNESDYIRMDRPLIHRQPLAYKGMHDHSHMRPPTLPQVLRGAGMKSTKFKLDSRFIQDVNVLDGTIMAPSTPFTKIWRMRNNGNTVWPRGSQLLWIGGDRLSDAVSLEVEIPAEGLPVDSELDVAVDFIAPELPGRYVSYWRMASPSGQKFGQRVWVLIQVDASLKESSEGVPGLNLNLPPVSSGSTAPEIVNVNVEPLVEGSFPDPCNSNRVTELVMPIVDAHLNKDPELSFPINDTLLVGGGASSNVNPGPSSVSYPIIDFSLPVNPVIDMQTSAALEVNGNMDREETLLRELEDMGFKQVDLNKEILRMNEYDLEQSVDALCGVSEWDPILEELKEMGFCDDETNKRLLKKNNGSIKRVVMDLITGEKA